MDGKEIYEYNPLNTWFIGSRLIFHAEGNENVSETYYRKRVIEDDNDEMNQVLNEDNKLQSSCDN